jgi:hypothetical protein
VNLDVLKQLVGDQTVTDAEEKYGINWHGKRKARQLALTPSTGKVKLIYIDPRRTQQRRPPPCGSKNQRREPDVLRRHGFPIWAALTRQQPLPQRKSIRAAHHFSRY